VTGPSRPAGGAGLHRSPRTPTPPASRSRCTDTPAARLLNRLSRSALWIAPRRRRPVIDERTCSSRPPRLSSSAHRPV